MRKLSTNLARVIILFCLTVVTFQLSAQDQPTEKKKGIDIIITQSPKILVKIDAVTHNTCNGEQKGAINISAYGGYPPYKYYWSSGDTTQDVAGLKAGQYKVAVYDGFSCSDTVTVKIEEPEKLLAKIMSVKDIVCYGYNNGEIDISVSGGKAPYKFSWSDGSTSEDLTGVNSGRYSVLITDANYCQEIITADIAEKPLIVRSVDDVQNIKCHGDSTGSVDITVTGGVPPYSYQWNNGQTVEDLRNLKAGVYDVVVKDSEGCTEVSSTKVVEPAALSITFDKVNNLRCHGDFGGAININVLGGKQPYTYRWNNGKSTQDIAGIQAGEYTVQVVDVNGCSTTISSTITEPDPLTVTLVQSKNVLNHGGRNGSIDINVAGGVGPYKYKWSNNSTRQDIDSLAAGNYSVRVTDANGCAKIMNVTITQPSPLVVKLDYSKNISCNGNKTGEIGISVTGGIPPYTYKWSNGAVTEDISEVPAGKYSVVVTDANGHQQKVESTLTEPTLFKAQVASVKDILCYGDKTGAIDIQAEGGVQPYRYRWSNGYVSQDIDRVPAGEYSVKVLDANHCEVDIAATIKQPELLSLKFDNVADIKCMGDTTGLVDLAVSGGVAPYKYKWSNGSTTQDLKAIKAGTYNVQVTDSKGCIGQLETKVSEPRLLTLAEHIVKNVDCNGNSTGQISLHVSGGVTPYKYKWNTGDTVLNISGKKAGNYALKVTDANGCVASYSKTITEPSKLVRSTESVTNILCFGDNKGAVNINVSGGVVPYSYRWSNGATTQDIIDIRAGKYSVLIKDANGCSDSLTAVVNENPALSASAKATHIKCYGQTTGAVDLLVEGGVAPYNFKWSNGSSTQNIAGLASGNYSVIVKDSKGCSRNVDAQITEPPRFVASLESDMNLKCYGQNTGAINVRVSGGVTPYRYKWSNGDTTKNVSQLPVGKYTLVATDANGCTQTVSSTLTQPPKITFAVKSVKDVSCNGDKEGAVDISVSGGIGPFAYKWNNGATTQDILGVSAGKYSVDIIDANGCVNKLEAEIKQPPLLSLKLDTVRNIMCNGDKRGAINISVSGGVPPYAYSWSNGATTEDVSQLPAGNYTVSVFDSKGCSKSVSAQISEPAPLEAKLREVRHISCYGDKTGSVQIDVIGGVKPYVFKWSNGSTTQNISNVPAGTYTVDIIDKNGCTQKITAVINQPQKLSIVLNSAKNISCYGGADGAINVTVTGGTAPFKYTWSNSAATQDLMGLAAGTYSLTVQDGNGCRDTSITATLKQPPVLEAKVSKVTDIARYGQNSGAVDISVTGGVAPYSYSWSNGATTQDISAVPGGNYSVLVTDANGCEKTVNALINQPPALSVKLASVQDIKCSGEKTGSITISVAGGVEPYSYKWNNGDSTQNIRNVPAGDYSVTVTDASGYHQTLSAKISQPSPLVIKTDAVKDLLCFNDKTGAVNVTVTGGEEPYKYAWNSGQSTQDIANLTAGDYSLTVTDGFGCKNTISATVKQPEQFTVAISDVKNISCKGQSKGEVHLEVKGGVTPYSYYWSNGARTKDVTSVMAGKYSVKVSDANGCLNTVEATIAEPSELTVALANVVNNSCFGESKGAIDLSVNGGTKPYAFEWSNDTTSQNLANVPKGEYSAVVTDANGCTKTVSATITEPPAMSVSVTSVTDVNCYGETTGKIDVSVSGGTTPYSYVWNNGSKQQDIVNVPAGDYQLTVRDAKGCGSTISASIKQPQSLAVSLDTIHHVLCHGDNKGMVDVIVSGGTLPYGYVWSNGANSEDLINVMAGTYSLKVNDAKGCVQTLSATINQPQKLSLLLDSLVNIKCSGDETGKISVHANGGMEPYSYSWSNGGSGRSIRNVPAGKYTVSVVDKNNCQAEYTTTVEQPAALVKTIDAITDIRCNGDSTGSIFVTVLEGVGPYKFNWNNGATTEDVRGLTAGNYRLTITESNGCQSFLEASIEEPTVFNAAVASTADIQCFANTTGAVDITVSGGVEPYAFTWSNGAKTEDLVDVGADSYSVMVSDANGCLRTLHAEVKEPELLTLRIDSVRNVKCCGDNSGAIFITVTGGVKPYKYEWSNGASSEDIENLVLGVYTVNVTDANGCVVSTPDDMTLYEQVVSKGMFTTRDILFDVGKSVIKAESFTTINKIASFMKEHQDISFRIDGHTDADGTEESNQKLSQDRAKAIKDALIKFGIREYRLEAKGWGESKPIASNTTAEGKALNRRVEFIALTGTLEGTLIENEIREKQVMK